MKDLDFMDDLFEEDDYKNLRKRIAQAKNDLLMEEPCPIYEPHDDGCFYEEFY